MNYKEFKTITPNAAKEWLRQNGLPDREDYANRVLEGVNAEARNNYNNAMNGGDVSLKNLAIKNSRENLEQNMLEGSLKEADVIADRNYAITSLNSMSKLTDVKDRAKWLKDESDKIGKQFGINLGWLAEFAGFDAMSDSQKNFVNVKWQDVMERLKIEAKKNNDALNNAKERKKGAK